MLRRRGIFQPVHSYEKPQPREDYRKEKASIICSFCTSHVFDTGFGHCSSRALTAHQGEGIEPGLKHYERLGSDFYLSTISGCKWCTVISNGVLTSLHLDYWYDRWNGSQSDTVDEDTSHAGTEESSRSSGSGEEVDLDPGLLTLDALNCQVVLKVQVQFSSTSKRPTHPATFDLVTVSVEVTLNGEGDDKRNSQIRELSGDEAVDLTFEILDPTSYQKHGAAHQAAFPPKANVLSDIELKSWVTEAGEWLRGCRESHELCRDHQRPFMPTRLLELDGPLRLFTSEISTVALPYAALSYVWGFAQSHVLTTSTLAAKTAGIDQTQLPKTIQDAIEIARKLGFSYLWVDSLCILQDSDNDKQTQLPLMGSIYRNAALTIIAASASSALEGFLRPSEDLEYFVAPFNIPLTGDGETTAMTLGHRSNYKPWKDPVNSRAWTLQERALSTRALIFAHDGPKWACHEAQTNPSASFSADPSPSLAVLSFTPPPEELDVQDTALWYRRTWLELRNEYTSRMLSVASDRLPAIQGVADEIAAHAGWRYLARAGLWKEYLFLDLHWHRDPASRGNGQLGAASPDPGLSAPLNALLPRPDYKNVCPPPTWSWASVTGAVVDADDEGDLRRPFHFRIIRCDEGATNLVVEGLTKDLTWRDAGSEDLTDGFLLDVQGPMEPSEEEEKIRQEWIVGEAALDASDTGVHFGSKVKCLTMSRLEYENRTTLPVEGLLLQPCKDSRWESGPYCRVGFFRIYSSTLVDGLEVQAITII